MSTDIKKREENMKQVLEEIEIDKLFPHEYNETVFGTGMAEMVHAGATGEYTATTMSDLKESIKHNGILEPLHVTSDYRILSGHRRRLIGISLGIKKVRVLRFTGKLDAAMEKLLILEYNIKRKDKNLATFANIRDERIKLYYELIPDFEELVITKKIDSAKTAEKLNISKKSFDRDLSEIRKDNTKKINLLKANEKKINLSVINSTKRHISAILTNQECSNDPTNKEIEKVVKKFYTMFIKRMK